MSAQGASFFCASLCHHPEGDDEAEGRRVLLRAEGYSPRFAQSMAANRAPAAGISELIVKAVDVTGKLGLHDQPTGIDDVWA